MATGSPTESSWPWFVSLIHDSELNETFLLVSQAPLVFVTVCNAQTRKATTPDLAAQIDALVRRTASDTYNYSSEDGRINFRPLVQHWTTLSAAKAYHDHNQAANIKPAPFAFADSKSIIDDSSRLLSCPETSTGANNSSQNGIGGGFAFLPYEFASFQIDEWRSVYGLCTTDWRVSPVRINGISNMDRLEQALDVVFETAPARPSATTPSPRVERYSVRLLNGPFSTLQVAAEHAKSWSSEGQTADIGQALAQKLNYTSYGPAATRVGGSS